MRKPCPKTNQDREINALPARWEVLRAQVVLREAVTSYSEAQWATQMPSGFGKRDNAGKSAADRVGWGGRIRTSEWRDQNPLPYHLATPHHK
jgi:hypothetical protein